MAKLAVFLCLLALCNASIEPRDLADEAEKLLQELISIVQGRILAAHNSLDDLSLQFQVDSMVTYENAQIDLQQEYETIDSQVTTIVDLAISAGYDVTRCTNYREETLARLPAQYDQEIYQCIIAVTVEKEVIVSDATYIIDILMTKVHNLERQLRSCRGDILCLSPIITEIELYKISLVQDVEKEVQAAEQLLTTLELSVTTCSQTNLADFVAKASSILSDITACIDRILG